jgi:large subunit ribosomal protein L21
MYAVIKTGGKQYRVQPGDLLVVEKLDGDVGADVAFDQVLMFGGDGGELTLGAPTIEGAVVRATLVETRKGEKIKIFKKIRRQGYRRTGGHRQFESVLRVTSIGGGGKIQDWDGTVDLTPRSVLNARARGLKIEGQTGAPVAADTAQPEAPAAAAKAPRAKAPKADAAPAADTDAFEGALVEQPISEVEAGAPETVAAEPKPAKKAAKPKAEATEAGDTETTDTDAAAKPARAKKAKPADDGGEA